MKNWRDYVGLQQVTDYFWYKPSKFNIQYIRYDFSLKIDAEFFKINNYTMDELAVGYAIEYLLTSFPKWTDWLVWNEETQCEYDVFLEMQKYRICNRIAKNTCRGRGNTLFETDKELVYFYNGKHIYDRPILVSEYLSNEGSKGFVVMKHPDFDRYGFVVEK